MSDPLLSARFRLDGVVCTVDAMHGAKTLDLQRESVKQAAVADRLVMTKLDLAEAGKIDDLRHRLAALNPTARMLDNRAVQTDPNLILNCGLWDADAHSMDVRGWLNEEALRAAEAECAEGCGNPHHHHHHDHAHDRHDAHVSSFVLSFDQPVSWEPFATAIEVLISLRGENLLRLKGIVNAAESPKPLVIHGVQHMFHPAVTLPDWPDEDRRTRLVFITRDLAKEAVAQLLQQALEQPAL
jgi:G3E family GTPase